MDRRTRRSPARFLAPLALVAVLVAFMAILTSSGNDGSGSPASESTTTSTSRTTSTKTTTRTKAKKKAAKGVAAKTYTIQTGDTLGSIEAKTGVPLSRIEELNPNVDPHAMTTGQQIR